MRTVFFFSNLFGLKEMLWFWSQFHKIFPKILLIAVLKFNCLIEILLLNRCYLGESRLYSWRKYCCIQYSVVTRIQHDLYMLIADILDCYCKRVVYELCELLHHFAELQYMEWLFSYGVWQKNASYCCIAIISWWYCKSLTCAEQRDCSWVKSVETASVLALIIHCLNFLPSLN